MKTLNILKEVEGKGLNIITEEEIDETFTVHIQVEVTEYYLKGQGTTYRENSFCENQTGQNATNPTWIIDTLSKTTEFTYNICQDCVKGFKEI